MSSRKLWISTISNLRSSRWFSSKFNSKFNSTLYSCSSSHMCKSKFFHSCNNHFQTKDRCFAKNFCSESSNASVSRCWNCNAVTVSKPFLACDSCKTVQPMDPSVDYFQIYGLEKAYEIEDFNLERKYKDWQKKLHPDLVHTKSKEEKEYAAEQSSNVIEAYRTLKTPLLRAIYLLRLEGIHVDEEQTVSDPELLAEIMEIREAVDEATDRGTLEQIQCQVNEKLTTWSNSFGDAFRNRKFEEAINSIRRMTYYHRINEEITKKI